MKRFSLLIVLAIFIIAGAAAWWRGGTQAVNQNNTTKKTFIISQGENIREIANQLKEEKLINDPVVFFLLLKQMGLDGKIQAGSFSLSPSMKPSDIAKTLTTGTQDIWITIPEGKRAEEIAQILQKNLKTYDPTWVAKLKEHEGYLFPDTYLFPKEASIDLIISTLTNTFDQKYATIAPQSKWSKEEVVNIAALVEREAKHAQDRPLVASVIENRLDIGMGLNVDATIQYIIGYDQKQKKWWRAVTVPELRINSPYNTYTHSGLPPAPIANPGLASLQAAAHPANTDYIYYFTDKDGINRYSKTLDEHNAQIEKYGL